LKTQEKPCAWHEACSFSSSLTLILADVNGNNNNYYLLLNIMCGYQCDKAMNKNDTREVI